MVTLVGVALALSGTLLVTPSAQAATARNGVCEDGEFCLYYNSNQHGRGHWFNPSIAHHLF
ncbi:peptidase inhibitor family I36 protein [Amycolatopsis orientalis]|uniref:peptidase inhibitor family I36 protein n=1 Tax=Amycolatopsis orientalis TaxID=31958 RepID=UPI00040B42CF|nr:peptidase inhibitor family I36 protein [Amycolatopsis orientalis]